MVSSSRILALAAVGIQGVVAFSPSAVFQLAGRSTSLRPALCSVPTLRTAKFSLRMQDDTASPAAEAVEVSQEEATALKKTSIKKSRPKGKDKKPMSEFTLGSMVPGKVVSIMPYGAFVDIGATTDGLVHVSQLADDFVKDIESVVKVGDDVQVRITEINAETNKVSLSMRSENAKPLGGGGGRKAKADVPEEFKNADDKVFIEGTVASVTEYGAFVTIAEGIDGLVHVSQLSEDRVEKAEKFVKIGQKVQVRIIQFDKTKKRLSLSMKAWTEAPVRDETDDIKQFVDEAPEGKTAFEMAWEKAQSKVSA